MFSIDMINYVLLNVYYFRHRISFIIITSSLVDRQEN